MRQKEKQRKNYLMTVHLLQGVDSPSVCEGASKSGKTSDNRPEGEAPRGSTMCVCCVAFQTLSSEYFFVFVCLSLSLSLSFSFSLSLTLLPSGSLRSLALSASVSRCPSLCLCLSCSFPPAVAFLLALCRVLCARATRSRSPQKRVR